MKKIVKKVILILACTCLMFSVSGCKVVGIFRNAEAKERVATVLKERYGEEFVVKDVWGFKGTGFTGLAYPKRDKSLMFEGLYNLEESPYTYDRYDQAIIAKQLKEIVQPDLEALFGECYINAEMMGNPSEITNVEDITIENYVATADRSKVYFEVGINTNRYTSSDYSNEYNSIVKTLQKINELGVGVTIENYFLPEQTYGEFVTHFQNSVQGNFQFDKIVDGYPQAGMAVIDEAARQTFEEYLSERKELSK